MEQIKISFDGGQTLMNFAEAALLIQGSACIYSKKVSKNVSFTLQSSKNLAWLCAWCSIVSGHTVSLQCRVYCIV